MILSGECYCGQKLEFEAEELSQLNCPNCGRPLADQFKAPPSPPPARTPPRRPARKPEPVPTLKTQSTLNEVRAESCYKTLRGLINTVVGLGLCVCVLLIIAGIAGAFQFPTAQFITTAVVAAAIGIIGIVLMVAIKEALLLAIDGVDLLIADRTDRKAADSARRQLALQEFDQTVGK